MSECLVVAVLVGPRRLRKADSKYAVKQARKVIEEAKALLAKMEANSAFDVAKKDLKKSYIQFLMSHEQYSRLSEARNCIETLAEMNPSTVVEDFENWWNAAAAKDTVWRLSPSNRREKVVVCGESSYGDSPDGIGWTHIRYAEWLNLFPFFGIK
jgi:Sec-independent protein translocase protein TatA